MVSLAAVREYLVFLAQDYVDVMPHPLSVVAVAASFVAVLLKRLAAVHLIVALVAVVVVADLVAGVLRCLCTVVVTSFVSAHRMKIFAQRASLFSVTANSPAVVMKLVVFPYFHCNSYKSSHFLII